MANEAKMRIPFTSVNVLPEAARIHSSADLGSD
jgi:hypothetical protein